MSTTWYPGMTWKDGYADDTPWEIAVDNPGYGQVYVANRPRQWETDLAGDQVGTWLRQLTTRALAQDTAAGLATYVDVARATLDLPAFIGPPEARLLLPSFQLATVLAAAGSDRFDRIFVDAEDGPHRPLCARCDEGTFFTPGALPSEWCDRHGHHPFGMHDGARWEGANADYERRYAAWQRQRGHDSGGAGDRS